MKLTGSIFVIVAALLLGIGKARELKLHRDTLREMISFLTVLNGEIVQNLSPYGKILDRLNRDNYMHMSGFIDGPSEALRAFDDRSFSEKWSDCVTASLGVLAEDERLELTELSNSLGRFDSTLQSKAIMRAKAGLEAKLVELDATLRERQKLYIAFSTGAGLILTIVLC